MTRHEQDIFFSLIRAGIWTDEKGKPTAERMNELERLVPDGYDWTSLLEAFERHAMLGVVVSTIVWLPKSKKPDMNTLGECYNHIACLARTHYVLQQEIDKIFTLLKENGLHPVLLKGEGLAALYPHTAVRACGDIDLYVPQDEYKKAEALLTGYCGAENLGHNSEHHLEMKHGSIVIELHKTPCGSTLDATFDAFCNWSSQRLDRQGDRPDAYYNMIYVFQHLLHHIVFGHPALRQFIDWALVIAEAKRQGVLDEKNLAKDLKHYSSLAAWQSLSGILHSQFGMSSEEIPLWNAAAAERSQGEFLQYMLEAGNFGQDTTRGIIHLWHSAKRFYSLWRVIPDIVAQKLRKRIRNCFHQTTK